MGPIISVNLSLGLPTEVSLERLYGLAGNPRVPPDAANQTERLVSEMGSTMTFWPVLYIACTKKVAGRWQHRSVWRSWLA